MRRFALRLVWLILLVALAACQSGPIAPTEVLPLPVRLIASDGPQRGELLPGQIQIFRFVSAGGQRVWVQASGDHPLSVALTGPDGAALAEGPGILESALLADGVYNLSLSADEATTYLLKVAIITVFTPAPTATRRPTITPTFTPTPPFFARLGTLKDDLHSGLTTSGTFAAPEERHVYRFAARTGQYLTAQMTRVSGGVDPFIRLYGPSGAELALDDNSGGNQGALLRNVPLYEMGDYVLQVWGRGFSGQYRLSLLLSDNPLPVTPTLVVAPTATPFIETLPPAPAPAVPGQPLADHMPVLGALDRPGGLQRFPVPAASGRLLTVGVSPATGSALRPRLELYDPLGLLAASATWSDSTAGGDALIAGFIPSQTGTYLLFVTGDQASIGSFVVSFGEGYSRAETPRGLAVPDRQYSAALNRRAVRDSWSLDLRMDDVINVIASPLSSGFDPLIELVAPDGALVAMDDNSGGDRAAQIVSARAPVGGRYRLRISSVGGTTGQYSLLWRYINLAPTPTPPPPTIPLLTLADTVPDSTYQRYPFQGLAGMQVRVAVIGLAGTGFDPVAALIGPDGVVVAEGDDGEDDLNPRFAALLPADGTYFVRVNGYLAGGAFELRVEQVLNGPDAPVSEG